MFSIIVYEKKELLNHAVWDSLKPRYQITKVETENELIAALFNSNYQLLVTHDIEFSKRIMSVSKVKVFYWDLSAGYREEKSALDLNVSFCLTNDKSSTIVGVYIDRIFDEIKKEKGEILYSKKENMTIEDRIVIKDGIQNFTLTNLEFRILCFLLKSKNSQQSRDVILKSVWGESVEKSTRVVDTHVTRLRKKLGLRSIVSVRGLGYMWLEP